MTTAIISLRETFETALILCVLLSYFARKKEQRAALWMWMGTGAGVVWSVLVAVVLIMVQASLSEEFTEIYEGIMMIAATVLLSWMVLWMAMHGRKMKHALESQVARHLSTGYLFGVALTSFLATAREGTELVILTHAALLSSAHPTLGLVGSGVGIAIAVGLGWVLYRGSARLPISTFFTITGVMLIIIALMLLDHGLEELAEAHVLPESMVLIKGIVALWGIALSLGWILQFRKR